MNQQLRPQPAPLPATTEAMLQQRKNPRSREFNELVEEIYLRVCEREEYRRYMYAVYNEQAVEGRQEIDDYKAAELIRQYATENDMPEVSRANIATIDHAHQVVLRRYRQSRKERRNRVGDTVVPYEEGGGNA